MSALYSEVGNTVIDAHQHMWEVTRHDYEWIPKGSSLFRDFSVENARTARAGTGITGVILVQAADTFEDTEYLLAAAGAVPEVRGVVGWVPLDMTDKAEAALTRWETTDHLKGLRCLSHNYPDPEWILKPEVGDTLRVAAGRGLAFDYVVRSSDQIDHFAHVASLVPEMTMVLDHLGNPPIASGKAAPHGPSGSEPSRNSAMST